jgi:epoxyqueuosine reductase
MMLLHVCCADCALKMIDAIKKDVGLKTEEIHLFFYNPNIHPQSEFTAREIALQKIARENNLKLIIANWTPKNYFDVIKILDSSIRKDKNKRCPICWRLRLTELFKYAKQNDYKMVSSTLLTSKYMCQTKIEEIALEISQDFDISFYQPNVINHELSTSGFYKQNYCGCIYSLLEKYQDKYENII